MPHVPQDNDPKSWHSYFAIECNNRAWDLAARSRSAVENEEMLNTAHASALHWGFAGEESNRMSALMLLAEVHALVGNGSLALDYAEQMRRFFLKADTPDWELAFTHTIYAHAAYVAGDTETFEHAYEEARRAVGAISDTQDREVVLQTFNQVPTP
jgi:hypothetical protein